MSSLKRMVTARLRGGNTTPSHPPANSTNPQPPEPSPAPPKPTPQSGPSALLRRKASRSPSEPPSPTPSSTVFPLFHLPVSIQLSLPSLFPSPTPQLHAADAARTSLITALNNSRPLPVLASVIHAYLPYIHYAHSHATSLRATGTHLPVQSIPWTSALALPHSTVYRGSLAMEACFILTLHGLISLTEALHTETPFATHPPDLLVPHIRNLQAAAGVFQYLRDNLAPPALADFQGTPPPEIIPDTADMLAHLALAAAQTLLVRRAALSDTSPPLLTKLSLSASELASKASAQAQAVEAASTQLFEPVKRAAADLATLTRAWAFQYHARCLQPETDAGARVSALGHAVDLLSQASTSKLVGDIAVVDIDQVKKDRDDASGENKIVYQHAIPKPHDLQLPPPRALAHAAKFELADPSE